MVTAVDAATACVLTVKLALVAPAGMVTVAGTLAALLLLDSATCAPPEGAAALSVTVPVEICTPPTTLVGFSVKVDSVGAAAIGEGCSKTQTAGFGSLSGTTTNLDGEIV